MSFVLAGIAIAGATMAVAGGTTSAIMAGKAKKEAAAKAQDEKVRMDQLKAQYASLDTSNPFLNQENKFEDLTVNQQQAQFQAQQFQQSQANILDSLRGAAGGSGIAALAQQLAQQGDIAAQRASATIGQQEAANQRMAAQEAARLQTAERQGEVMSRNWERDQVGTLLGMSQNTYAAYAQAETAAQQAQIDAISGIGSNVSSVGSSYINSQG